MVVKQSNYSWGGQWVEEKKKKEEEKKKKEEDKKTSKKKVVQNIQYLSINDEVDLEETKSQASSDDESK